MSERDRATRTSELPRADFVYAIKHDVIKHDAMNRHIGVHATWLVVAMTLIGAADAALREGFGASSNAFPEIQWVLFCALFLLAVACALQRRQHARVDLRQTVKLRPDPNDNIPAVLKAAHERHKKCCAVNPVMPSISPSRKVFRYARFHPYCAPEIGFRYFMTGQQLPFR